MLGQEKEMITRLKYEAEYRTRLVDYVNKQVEFGTIKPALQMGFNFIMSGFGNYEKMNFKSIQKGKRKKLNINY